MDKESFKVEWDDASLPLQTRRAAILLVDSFRSEGREAKAYENVEGDWREIFQ